MHYTVYKTTNLVNGKVYIGTHQTDDPMDEYLGSGKRLKRAIAKYGIENFRKEILFNFDNASDMFAKEAELVTEDFCKRDDTYNICPGGQGGWGYINSLPRTETQLNALRMHSRENGRKNGSKTWRKNFKLRGDYIPTFLGRKHSDETRLKMSKTKNQGEINSQFGTMWITNGFESRKIKKFDKIPEGWYKGRKILH